MISNPCGVAHFQNKPCRECEEARRKKTGPGESPLSEPSAAKPDVTETRTESKVTTTDTVVITEEEIREKIERGEISLTNADRCRRWRSSGDVEAKREANKLRMRRKRL